MSWVLALVAGWVLILLVAGAVLAPDGSPVTMMLIAAPMYVLFEISIWLIVFMEKRWKREAAAEAA